MTNSKSSITSAWREKRKIRRQQREADDENDLFRQLTENEEYVPHVSAAKKLLKEQEDIFSSKFDNDKPKGSKSRKLKEGDSASRAQDSIDQESNAELIHEGPIVKKENEDTEKEEAGTQTLLEQAAQLKNSLTSSERERLQATEEESRILREASKIQTNALQAASELAQGVIYKTSFPTTWTCPRYILKQDEKSWNETRKNWHILVEGTYRSSRKDGFYSNFMIF